MQLPQRGRPWAAVRQDMVSFKERDWDWRSGKLQSFIYYANDELLEVQKDAYSLYLVESGLGKRRAFKSLGRMEDEVVQMALGLLGGQAGSDGLFTSGGTESLYLAVKAARDWARTQNRFRAPFQIVASKTAHPGFNRAAEALGLEVLRHDTRGQDPRADVEAIAASISDRTIMVVGSAPDYPGGVIDPIPELARVALNAGLWMHVDACVGGFVSPFARMNGHPIPPFDLSVEGVTTLSADLHKYGFTAKGASLLLFNDGQRKGYAGFSLDWPKGTYSTETFQGTRAGGAIACAWAVMNYLGVEGYRALVRTILDTAKALTDGIDRIPGLRVNRPFDLCIFSYFSEDPDADINVIGEIMMKKGWYVSNTLHPRPSLQFAVLPVHQNIVGEYLSDLGESVDLARQTKRKGKFDVGTY